MRNLATHFALAVGLCAGFALAASRQIGPTVDDATPVWSDAQLHNNRDGTMTSTVWGEVKLTDGGVAVPPVNAVQCTGPAAFTTVTTCFGAWKTANGLP